jgi:hypothetical protein
MDVMLYARGCLRRNSIMGVAEMAVGGEVLDWVFGGDKTLSGTYLYQLVLRGQPGTRG